MLLFLWSPLTLGRGAGDPAGTEWKDEHREVSVAGVADASVDLLDFILQEFAVETILIFFSICAISNLS